jgi:hypothetical protein
MEIILICLGLTFFVLMIASFWTIFTKAGKPGWAAIIPIYNIIVLLEIAGKPWWWIFLFLLGIVPIIGQITVFILSIMMYHGLSKSFGKDAGFTVGLILLFPIFLPILAFGDAQYLGTKKAGNSNVLDEQF